MGSEGLVYPMKKTSLLSLLMILTGFGPLRASAATVYVSYYGLSPNPVNVKVGETVAWVDADPDDFFAPYMITFPTLYGFTPCWTQFATPGTRRYTAESAYGGGTWSGTVNVTPNFPPVVIITGPTNGAIFTAPASFSFEADASDPNTDDIWDVEFWIGDTMVDDVYAAPYLTAVTNLAVGTYTLKAVVWDYSSATATNSITVTVVDPPPITLGSPSIAAGKLIFNVSGLATGKTNVLFGSSNMVNWSPIQTNVCDGTSLNFTNTPAGRCQFFRVMQVQ